MQIYCVKCKSKVNIPKPDFKTSKNGRKMATGTCPKCGIKVSSFVKSDAGKGLYAAGLFA